MIVLFKRKKRPVFVPMPSTKELGQAMARLFLATKDSTMIERPSRKANMAAVLDGIFDLTPTTGDPIPRLREYWGVPAPAGVRFKEGDIVVPKKHSHAHAIGEPHLVIEIPAVPLFYAPQGAAATEETPTFSKCWGARLDMRVLHVGDGGEIHAHWVESWAFEAWPVDGS